MNERDNRPVFFVSLGPGDSDLVTLKAYKTLAAADKIYCPTTLSRDGKMHSRAIGILKGLEISEGKISTYHLPMTRGRKEAQLVYQDLALELEQLYLKGEKLVITAEGDAGFYSSTQYIYELLEERNIPVKRLSGIPAFIEAGARAGIHIVKGREALTVLPGTATQKVLESLYESNTAVVVMKLSSCMEEVKRFLQTNDGVRCHYFERIGDSDEFYATDIQEILARPFPYFSLIILEASHR